MKLGWGHLSGGLNLLVAGRGRCGGSAVALVTSSRSSCWSSRLPKDCPSDLFYASTAMLAAHPPLKCGWNWNSSSLWGDSSWSAGNRRSRSIDLPGCWQSFSFSPGTCRWRGDLAGPLPLSLQIHRHRVGLQWEFIADDRLVLAGSIASRVLSRRLIESRDSDVLLLWWWYRSCQSHLTLPMTQG